MAIVNCPDCGKKLKVADTSIGKKVKCSCGSVFVAEEPDAAPARPAVAAPADKVMVECTECSAKLKVASTSLGKKMKCPKCASVFIASAEEDDTPPPPVKKAPPVVLAADDDDEEEVKPKGKAKPKASKKGDDDDLFMFAQGDLDGDDGTDMKMDDDEDAKPRGKGKAKPKKSEEEDDDNDWSPPKSRAKPPTMRDDDDEEPTPGPPVYPSRMLANIVVAFLLLVYVGLFAVTFFQVMDFAKELGLNQTLKIVDANKKNANKEAKSKSEDKKKDDIKGSPENDKDIDALQGTWIVESAAMPGFSLDQMKGHKFFIAGTNITTPDPVTGPFKLDATKNPKWIELPTAAKLNIPGIYSLEGDSLQWCTALPKEVLVDGKKTFQIGERPNQLDAKQGVLVVMRREKKQEDDKKPKDKDKDKEPGKEKDKEPGKSKANGADAAKLVGAWVIESAATSGKSNDLMKGEILEFADGKVSGIMAVPIPYAVNAGDNPGWIDLKLNAVASIAGLYKFDGEKLILCTTAGKDPTQRPKDFDGATTFLVVLRRATKDDPRFSRILSGANLRQIGLAIHNHHDTHNRLPAAASSGAKDPNGTPLLSWRVAILPYIEQLDLYKEFDLDKPWNDPHNMKLVAKMPKLYMAPGMSTKEGMTHYRTPVGPGTLLNPQKGPGGMLIAKYSLTKLPDGPSNVIMVVEATEPTIWTKPDELPYDPKGPMPKLGVIPAGFNALFADGRVQFVPSSIHETVLRPYFTCDNGMPRAPLSLGEDKGKNPKESPKVLEKDKELKKDEPKEKKPGLITEESVAISFVQDQAPANWKVPKGWKQAKGNPFTVGAFVVQEKGEQIDVTVSVLNGKGGGLLANVNRWRAQLKLPEWSLDELGKAMKKRKVDRIDSYHVEFTGEKAGQPSTLQGVIVFREQDAWFFKLAGGPALAQRQRENFLKFVDSVKFRP